MAVTNHRSLDPVDRAVAARIRTRRQELGMLMPELGDLIGVSFRQISKYELGQNRVTAGRLARISKALGVPITYFYENT